MRAQGYNSNGELLSSAFVKKDDTDPCILVDCSDLPSLTRQEFAEDCDINTLMDRYETTGVITHFNNGVPQYLDLTDVPDLRMSLDILAEANAAFMRLPAKVRAEFDNDPTAFVDFASDPKNIDKMREYGLAPMPEAPPAPQKVEIVNPPSADKSDA